MRCPACGLFFIIESDEETHQCLEDGETRYSVEHVTPSVDDEAGNDYKLVMWSVSKYAVRINLSRKEDPENYRVTPWEGHEGLGTAHASDSVWGDEWMETN